MIATCPRCGQPGVTADACPRCGARVAEYRAELGARVAAQWPAPPPPLAPAAPVAAARPAGFWIRAVAMAVDWLVLLGARLVLAAVAWAAFGEMAGARPVRLALGLVGGAGALLYWIVLHALNGQTVGKMAVRIRVVTDDGGPVDVKRAAARLAASFLSSFVFGIGFLIAAFRADKRALHDLLAGTRVERLP